jgi:glycosyltransferase involved in cell wall biosynthesis/GT2 family glycosyltransferase
MTLVCDHRPLLELVSLAESYRLLTLPAGFDGWPSAKQLAWAEGWVTDRKAAAESGDQDAQRLARFACWRRIFPPVLLESGAPCESSGKPRIVHLMTWPVGIGGAPRMMHEWCHASRETWDVHVVTTGAAGPWDWSGVTVHCVAFREQIAAVVNRLSPDVVVNHTPFEQCTQDIQAPQVWIMHGMPFLRKAPPKGVRPVCVFSNLDAPGIRSAWKKFDWRVLPVGVDLERFRPAETEHKTDGVLTLGIVGRLHPEKFPRDPRKRLATSLSAALRRWDHGPWRLKIIGQGNALEWQQQFRDEVADLAWVEFLPDVPPAKMAEVYHSLDALLVPTPPETGETACYSAVEAMACGVPVVARDLPGLRQSCRGAALYGETDADLLAAVRLLDAAGTRRQWGRAGRQVAESIHDLRQHVAVHSRAFAEAMPVDVSILTAVHNTQADYLRECWVGICGQTFRRWELVLIDDGSTDSATIATVDEIARDPRVRLIRLQDNRGAAAARNAGLAECRADLVAVMDSDDVAMSAWLEKQVAWIKSRPNATAVGCQIQLFDSETGHDLHQTQHPADVTRAVIDRQRNNGGVWFVNHPGAVYRRKAVQAVGGYPSYSVCHDLAMWLRLFRAGAKICNTPDVLVRYRKHGRSLTLATDDRKRQYQRVLREVLDGRTS